MCTKPMKGFKYGKTNKGKDNYIITSYKVDHLEIRPNGKIEKCYDNKFVNKAITSFIEIPCGKCLECKLEYSKQWANRCMLEASQFKNNCFVTLTYNDQNVPISDFPIEYDLNTGEPLDYDKAQTLRKKDLQKFIKNLRSSLNRIPGKLDSKGNPIYYKVGDPEYKKIRYFASGEYGSKSKRPHYHLIIFNWIPDDLIQVGQNFNGDTYYKSPYLESLWPYGFNLVANVTWETCAYVSRYVAKKLSVLSDNDIYKNLCIEPEFVLMSRRPGIGKTWYNSHNVCYATFLNQYITTPNGSRKIGPNRYFDKILDQEDPERLCEIKKKRKEFAYYRKKQELSNTSLDYENYLQVKEENLLNKTKILKGGEL